MPRLAFLVPALASQPFGGWAMQNWMRLRGERSTEAEEAEVKQFEVTIQKSEGSKALGMDISFGKNASELRVRQVASGPVQQWNDQHPDAAVHPKDTIVLVNGKSSSAEDMLREAAEADTLHLKIRHGARKAAIAVPTQAPNAIVPAISREVGDSSKSPSVLIALNGYPGSHDVLLRQANFLKSQHKDVDLLLTSHTDAVLSSSPQVSVSKIAPAQFCSPFAKRAGFHKHKCNNPEADNKFLGAVFMANTTRHGFKWLLLGDDDTSFFMDSLTATLEQYDPRDPHFFALKMGKRGPSWERPAGYDAALKNCPPLGPAAVPRYSSYNLVEDVTDLNQDCDPEPFRDDSWFAWGKGGDGLILSAGLLDAIPAENWQKCIDRMFSFGGDVRLGMCLALNGMDKVEALGNTTMVSLHKWIGAKTRESMPELHYRGPF